MKITLFTLFTAFFFIGCGGDESIIGEHTFLSASSHISNEPLILTINEDGTYKYRSNHPSWQPDDKILHNIALSGTWEIRQQTYTHHDGTKSEGDYLWLSGQEDWFSVGYSDGSISTHSKKSGYFQYVFYASSLRRDLD